MTEQSANKTIEEKLDDIMDQVLRNTGLIEELEAKMSSTQKAIKEIEETLKKMRK